MSTSITSSDENFRTVKSHAKHERTCLRTALHAAEANAKTGGFSSLAQVKKSLPEGFTCDATCDSPANGHEKALLVKSPTVAGKYRICVSWTPPVKGEKTPRIHVTMPGGKPLAGFGKLGLAGDIADAIVAKRAAAKKPAKKAAKKANGKAKAQPSDANRMEAMEAKLDKLTALLAALVE